MAPSFEEIIQSPQFTFYIGDERKPVVVHAAAIASTSGPMNALINGHMDEADKQCATIEDVFLEDFIRFCEFAYRGDYTAPHPEIDTTTSITQNPVENEVPTHPVPSTDVSIAIPVLSQPLGVPESWDEFLDTPRKPKRRVGKRARNGDGKANLRARLQDRAYLADDNPAREISRGCQPNSNTHAGQIFTTVLLAHARLYSFANMRLIDPLKGLTLHKIRTILLGFKLYENRIGDIIELARYAYSGENTPDRKADGKLDGLRELIVEYIACEIDTIGKTKEWKELIEEGGELVADWWEITRTYFIVRP